MSKLIKSLLTAMLVLLVTGCSDNIKPVITLLGDAEVIVMQGETYEDAGATAKDTTYDKNNQEVVVDITQDIVTDNPVDTSKEGVYEVTYNVSDSAGNKADEVHRKVVVEKVPEDGNLVIHTTPGMIVAIHDTQTLAPIETHVAGKNGTVSFTIEGGERVTYSVSMGPDTEATEESIYLVTVGTLSDTLDDVCYDSDEAQIPSACKLYDKDRFLNTSGNAFIYDELYDLASGEDDISQSIDTNRNGSIDAGELYMYALTTQDSNSDGKITWSELYESEMYNGPYTKLIMSVFAVAVELGEYDAGFMGGNEPLFSYAQTTMSFSGFEQGGTILEPDSNYEYIDADGKAVVSSLLMEKHLDVNQKFAFSLAYEHNGNVDYLLALDKTNAEIRNLSYTPEDFNVSSETVTLISPEPTDTKHYALQIMPFYKKSSVFRNMQYVDLYSDTRHLIKDPRLGYYVNKGESTYDTVQQLPYNKVNLNYYKESFKPVYDAKDYPLLDINLSSDENGTAINIAGNDFTKLDLAQLAYSSYGNDGTSVSIILNYASVPENLSVPDIKSILPSVIADSLPVFYEYESAGISLFQFNKAGWIGKTPLYQVLGSPIEVFLLPIEDGARIVVAPLAVNSQTPSVLKAKSAFKDMNPLSDFFSHKKDHPVERSTAPWAFKVR